MNKQKILNETVNYFLKLPNYFKEKTAEQLEIKSTAYNIYEKVKDWDYKEPPIISILSTSNGCGKTFLAILLFKKYLYDYFNNNYNEIEEEIKNNGIYLQNITPPQVKFLSEKKLYYDIMETYDKKEKTEKEILDEYSNLDFLVIDDLFSTKENDFARRIIFYIIDERVEWKHKPTVITSNYLLKGIQNIDSRISGRLENKYCFEIETLQKNYRK